jgi:hypothetical protein
MVTISEMQIQIYSINVFISLYLQPSSLDDSSISHVISSDAEQSDDEKSMTASDEILNKSARDSRPHESVVDIVEPADVNDNDINQSTKKPLKRKQVQKGLGKEASKNVVGVDADSLIQVMKKVYEKELVDPGDTEQLDEISVFCQYVDRQLREVADKRLRLSIQHKIQNVIFEARFYEGAGPDSMQCMQPAFQYMQQQGFYPYPSFDATAEGPCTGPSVSKKNYEEPKNIPSTANIASHVRTSAEKKDYTHLQNTPMMTTRNMRKKRSPDVMSPVSSSGESLIEVSYEKL